MRVLRAAARLLSLTFSLVFLGATGEAWGQQRDQVPPLPLAVDLKKVKVGSWSDYSLITGTMRPLRQRMALVGKGGRGYEIELVVEGGQVPAAIVTRVELAAEPSASKRVKRAVMKAGVREAMEIPGSSDLVADLFPALDQKDYLGSQEIEVPGGRFQTKLYRKVLAGGVKVDYWVSENVHPVGVVKMDVDFGRAGASRAILKLVGTGAGARGTVLKHVRRFDEKKLIAEMVADMKAAAVTRRTGPPRPTRPR